MTLKEKPLENIMGEGKNIGNQYFLLFHAMFSTHPKTHFSFEVRLQMLSVWTSVNPLSHMSILGSSNSAANKDMMSKIMTNGGYNYLIE